jgi:hypothetical protein
MADEVLAALAKHVRFGELENELVGLLGYLRFDFIKVCLFEFGFRCFFFFTYFLSFWLVLYYAFTRFYFGFSS